MNLDVLPTAINAAGGQTDVAWKLDGVDLLPYLTSKNKSRPHETIYWRYAPQWAVRHGDMKLVVSGDGQGSPELYDLSSDRAESTNLASSKPEKVKELQSLFDAWNAEQIESTVPKEGNKKVVNNKKKKNKV